MKTAGNFIVLLALAAQAQVLAPRAFPDTNAVARWSVTGNFAFSSNSASRDWHSTADWGISYLYSAMKIGAIAHLNQSLSFAFLPPPLIIRVEDNEIKFPDDTRFRARPEQYEIELPFQFFAQFNPKRWHLFGAIAGMTQHATSEIARPNVVGDSLVFINWDPVKARNTRMVAALIAGYRWDRLSLRAGVHNLTLAQFGDKNFKHEYRPDPAPFLALAWRYKSAELRTSTNQQAMSFEYAQLLAPAKFWRGKSLDTQISYRTGFDHFSFQALRLQLTLPETKSWRWSLSYENVWSREGLENTRAFANWQQASVFDAMQSLNQALPHQSFFVGLKLALDRKPQPWPLQVVQLNLLQPHIYRAKRAFYASNPIGTITLHNRHQQPVKAQIVLETSNGAGVYRSEAFLIRAAETQSQPLYLYLQDLGADNIESFEQLNLSVVLENRTKILASLPVTIYGKNAWSGDTWELKYFVAPDDPAIRNHSKQLYLNAIANTGPPSNPPDKFFCLQSFLEALGKTMRHIPDPTTTMIVDQVQYPIETLSKGGGDCEDLVVFLASSLMAVGMQAAVVDVRPKIPSDISFPTAAPGTIGHVFLLVDTGIDVEYLSVLGLSEFQGLTRKNARGKNTIWIPLEATTLSNGFAAAWQEGVRQYYHEVIENDGMAKGWVHVYDF